MQWLNHELEIEFDNIDKFISEKYKVNIKKKEQLVNYVKGSLVFLQSLKIWNRHLDKQYNIVNGIDHYFKEMISNIIHVIILGTIDLKVPALVMLRRTQEIILAYLYYSEHPVEYYKKEKNDNIRNISGFNELKEYIKQYPFSTKYNVDEKRLKELVSRILDEWTIQYKNLSNYVHGTNSSYFQMISYMDEFKFIKKDVNYLIEQVNMTSTVVNMLLMVFYFNTYLSMDDISEKSIIRRAIGNERSYKSDIVEIFTEI